MKDKIIPVITSSCAIKNYSVFKNETCIYKHNSQDINSFLEFIYRSQSINYPKFFKMDHLSRLGFLASEILLDGHAAIKKHDAYKTGVILSNSDSSIDTDSRYLKSVSQIPSPALFVYTLPNIVIGEICIRNGFKGENTFFLSAEFNAVMMLSYLKTLFSLEILTACIFGWVNLFQENYKAVLWLAESRKGAEGLLLTTENINKIYY